MSRVWKIDGLGDLGLYVDGRFRGGYDPTDLAQATEVAAILERGQAEPLPFTVTDAMNPDSIEVSVVGVVAGSFRVHRCGASDKAWNALLDALDLRVVDPEPGPEPTKDVAWEAYYVEHPESRPAPVSDDPLPEGVHRAPDGTLLCKPKDLPDGWWFWSHTAEDWMKTGPLFPDRYHEVRPARPATERVPWVGALREQMPLANDREPITQYVAEADDTVKAGIILSAVDGSGRAAFIDADGLVEVLVES